MSLLVAMEEKYLLVLRSKHYFWYLSQIRDLQKSTVEIIMLNIQLVKLVNIIIGNIEYNSSEGGGTLGRGWGHVHI